jgi:hypothetical protein
MTPEEHKARHIELHGFLDELFADFITHGNGRTGNTIMELITWSFKQSENPDHS